MTETGRQAVKKETSWFRKNLTTIVAAAFLVTGTGLLLYPTVSDYWNSFHQSRAIISYAENAASLDADTYRDVIVSAREYNRRLCETGLKWVMSEEDLQEYEKELDISGSSAVGYIEIPKIDVRLALYHGTSDAVLHTGIGHVEGTSLPVGTESFDPKTGEVADPDEGCHIVLSGHRGLPSAKLFSDLDKLSEMDTFTITVLNEVFTYEVDQINIVEPTDVSLLKVEKGKDQCTLITCTPYGINTHRLLVRGHRIANAQGDLVVPADAVQYEPYMIAPFIAVPLILMLLVIPAFSGKKKPVQKRKERKKR